MSGLAFFTWGEIYSLFPAACTDLFGAVAAVLVLVWLKPVAIRSLAEEEGATAAAQPTAVPT